MSNLAQMVPEKYPGLRALVDSPDFEAQTLLLCLLDMVRRDRTSFEGLGLSGQRPEREESLFVDKLRTIAALNVVYQARGRTYTLDEQVEDFLHFVHPETLTVFHHVARFRRSSIQTILWTIEEERRLIQAGSVPFLDWQLPIDILVAIGDEIARWHEDLVRSDARGSDEPGLDVMKEEGIRALIEGTLVETYHLIEADSSISSMFHALDRVRARFGLYSIAAVVE